MLSGVVKSAKYVIGRKSRSYPGGEGCQSVVAASVLCSSRMQLLYLSLTADGLRMLTCMQTMGGGGSSSVSNSFIDNLMSGWVAGWLGLDLDAQRQRVLGRVRVSSTCCPVRSCVPSPHDAGKIQPRCVQQQTYMYDQPCKQSPKVVLPKGARIMYRLATGKTGSNCLLGSLTKDGVATIDKQCYIYASYGARAGWVPISADCSPGVSNVAYFLGCAGCTGADTHKCSSSDGLDDQLQMAASLMFKIKGVTWDRRQDGAETWCYDEWNRALPGTTADYAMSTFNKEGLGATAMQGRFALKNINAAIDVYHGPGSPENEWWINGMLVFGVDGLCYPTRDGGKGLCTNAGSYATTTPGQSALEIWDAERAYAEAYAVIEEAAKHPERSRFLASVKTHLRAVDTTAVTSSFGIATDPVTRAPLVGERLYVRETIHMRPLDQHVLAGQRVFDGGNLDDSIALSYYFMDSNGYRMLRYGYKGDTGKWTGLWMVAGDPNGYAQSDKSNPTQPTAIPYRAMLPEVVSNLLVAGYALNADAWAWAQVRMLPTLTVIGDAAGAAAALASVIDPPLDVASVSVKSIQEAVAQLEPYPGKVRF